MVLGIDASRFGHEFSTGVENYSYHIIRGLLAAISQDSHCPITEVILYTPREIQKRELGVLGGQYPFCRDRVITLPRLWTQVRLSTEMIGNEPDVLFIPSHTLPIIHPKKSVVMIHDVAFCRFRRAYSFFQYAYLQFSTWLAVREAAKILVPSHATRDDLIRFFGCKKEKIEVVPHGFSAPGSLPDGATDSNGVTDSADGAEIISVNSKEQKELLERFGIVDGEPYFFFVGRLEEKKNLVRLVRAFSIFREKYPKFKLILAGKRGAQFRRLFDEVEYLNLWGSVMMPGYVTEEEKAIFFKNCSGFVFPSLYEGFGLPVLDAFYFGKPVLASRAGALPEVCGNAAALVDPENEQEIFHGLKKITGGGALELIRKGREQLKKFDWEKTAKKTLKILLQT